MAPLIDRLMADADFVAARQLVAEAYAARDTPQAQIALAWQSQELRRVAKVGLREWNAERRAV